MIPKVQDDLKNDFQFEELPTNTFKLHIEQDKMYGFVDGLEAMKQAIYLILSIERYEYLILSWNYGVELADLFGQPVPFVLPELKRRISEALLQDDRITDVDEFAFDVMKGKVHCTFKAHTIFGEVEAEKVVNI